MQETSTVKTNKGNNNMHNEGGAHSKINSSITKLISSIKAGLKQIKNRRDKFNIYINK